MCDCMKNGTKELVERAGAIRGFAGDTSLFLLNPEDVFPERNTNKEMEIETVLGGTLQSTC